MQAHITQPASAPAHQPTRRKLDKRRFLTIALFLAPAVGVYLLLVLFPLVQAGYYGLFKWNGLGPADNFIGLDNYRAVLNDQTFRKAVSHNAVILFLSLTLQLPLALGLALIVGRQMRGRAFFRTVFFLPYVLSEVVTGVVWSFLYQPQSGINELLGSLFSSWQPRSWLGNPDTVLYALFIVITWKFVGFHIILYMAGLQGIPREFEEAAQLDGATPLRVTWDITVPLLGPTIRLSVFLAALGSLQFFDLIWIMTTGGPVNASHTMATYMYDFGFRRFQLGYGAAVSLIIFLICFGFALLYQRFIMRRDYDGSTAI